MFKLQLTCERISVIRVKQKSLLGVIERSKHDYEAKLSKLQSKYESLYVYPEKLTHFQVGWKADMWQSYRGTTQTKGKYPNPRKCYLEGSEMGVGV